MIKIPCYFNNTFILLNSAPFHGWIYELNIKDKTDAQALNN